MGTKYTAEQRSEMDHIAKLYSYMTTQEKDEWSRQAAQEMFDDEHKIAAKDGTKCPLLDVEELYDTIKHFIDDNYFGDNFVSN